LTYRFEAVNNPPAELLKKVERLSPANPFHAWTYLQARRQLGYKAVLISILENNTIVSACPALVKSFKLGSQLEIDSIPTLPDEPARNIFWQGLFDYCRQHKIADLKVNSYASTDVFIPHSAEEVKRTPRWEYLIDLPGADLWKMLRKSHRERVKKAAKAGVIVKSATDEKACIDHNTASKGSKMRRQNRGEIISGVISASQYMAYINCGAGWFYQAVKDGRVVSSIFVLIADRGAYTHSSGTTPEGMECGAAHFLRHEVSKILQNEKMELFNMAGVDQPESGLAQYKAGFGGRINQLESAEFYMGGQLRKKLRTAIDLLRDDPKRLLKDLTGKIEHYVVFEVNTEKIAPPTSCIDGLKMEKFPDEELLKLTTMNEEMREYSERLISKGFNDAYAFYLDGKLANIIWLVSSEHDRMLDIRNVKLRENEAEITHMITLKEFRGRGICPYCIQSLLHLASEKGIRRVYAITNIGNIASQRALEKGGLIRCAKIYRLVFDYLPGSPYITFRGHRWRLRDIFRG